MPSKPMRTPRNTVKAAGRPTFKVGDKLLIEVEITRVGEIAGREAVTVKLPGLETRHTYSAEYLPNHIRR